MSIEPWMGEFTSHYLDALWLPVALLVVHKGQKWKAAAFIGLCMVVFRLQMEIMDSTGFRTGFTGFFKMSLYHRGLIVYGIFILLYLILSRLSPYTKGIIYLAASLSIFFMAFFVSSIVMIL